MIDLSKPPDYVNVAGVKWWHDADTTNYARKKLNDRWTVYAVEMLDGCRTYLLLDGVEIVDDTPSLEAICCKIDILAYLEKQEGK